MARLLIFLTFLYSVHLILSSAGVYSATFTLVNQFSYTVWPALLSSAGSTQLSITGFALQTGESNSFSVPTAWSGRLWGRTLCTLDSNNKFSCVTGDCASQKLECAGAGAIPPASLAEFTLSGAGGMDFYDVSLVDGYNLPMEIVPRGGTGGNCSATGCPAELNDECPVELKVAGADGVVMACKSACEAFGSSMYCCSGEFASPSTCKPTAYSEYFKRACPDAYSYAYDDLTSTFTCAGADYVITFCPSPAPPPGGNPPGGAVHPAGSTNTPTPEGSGAGSALAATPLLMTSISISISILMFSLTSWWSG